MTTVQFQRYQYASNYTDDATVVPGSYTLPSVVECQGRTTSISISEATGDVICGGDVAAPQRWVEANQCWKGFGAGGGSDGTDISYPDKKTVAVREGPDYALWLSGSNGSGSIFRRDTNDALWENVTSSFWGTVNDGGSSAPRRSGARLIVIDGATAYISCERSAAPANGIARSTNSGATWTAWSFGTSRNYTTIRKSPNWDYLLACSDGRVGASQDGVWAIPTSSGTPSRWDNVGAGAPSLADVRDAVGVDENGDDCWFVVVGNAAGSDADRGVWRLRVSHDPNDGGFVAATHLTWTHIFTPGTNDRMQCIVARQLDPATGPIYLLAGYFTSAENATGTYTLSPGASGGTQNYKHRAVQCLNGDDSSPDWTVITNSTNVDMTTYGTQHDHVMSYVGEQSNEKSRMGGSSYQMAELAISEDGLTVYACGKSSPWITTNPWAGTPIWRPFSRGMGLLEGGYQSVYVPDISASTRVHGFGIADDDRGLYTFRSLNQGYVGPEWVVAENIDGAVTTDNAMFGVSVDPVSSPLDLLIPRRLNGRAYRVDNPFIYATASITSISPDTSAAPPAIGVYKWVDSLSATQQLIITSDEVWQNSVLKFDGFGSNAKRTEFVTNGSYAWLLIPDIGIYRTQDNGVNWALWWDHGIASTTTNRYAGHITLLPPDKLLVTWDTPGIWECAEADTSAAGTGIGGSRPENTSQITSGTLGPTDYVSAIDYDPVSGDVWACGYDPTGATANVLWVRRGSIAAWYEIADEEYAESAMIPQALTAYGSLKLIGTASNGTLMRIG